MSDNSAIQWTDATWNPTRGCSPVSPGCAHCYAERVATRFAGVGQPYEGLITLQTPKRTETGETDGPLHGETGRVRSGIRGRWNGQMRLVDDKLTEPLRWRRPRKVFVNSMSDLFHEGLTDEQIDQVFAVMALCPQHTFQVLTKRPERMLGYFDGDIECMFERWADAALTIQPLGDGENATEEAASRYENVFACDWPLPNVWLGVSVENQHFADERIPLLLQTPAAVRFISAEPLLEEISFRWAKWDTWNDAHGERRPVVNQHDGLRMLDWVIVGGESGHGSRPFDLAWARSIVQQCQAAGVPCFVKQLGAHPTDLDRIDEMLGYVDLRDKKGGDPAEWPADLRVRQFPMVA